MLDAVLLLVILTIIFLLIHFFLFSSFTVISSFQLIFSLFCAFLSQSTVKGTFCSSRKDNMQWTCCERQSRLFSIWKCDANLKKKTELFQPQTLFLYCAWSRKCLYLSRFVLWFWVTGRSGVMKTDGRGSYAVISDSRAIWRSFSCKIVPRWMSCPSFCYFCHFCLISYSPITHLCSPLLCFVLSWQCAWGHPSSLHHGFLRPGKEEMMCKLNVEYHVKDMCFQHMQYFGKAGNQLVPAHPLWAFNDQLAC